MPLKFAIELKQMRGELRPFFAPRPRRDEVSSRYVDLNARNEALVLTTTGHSRSLIADVRSGAYARIRYSIFATHLSKTGKVRAAYRISRVCALGNGSFPRT